MGLPGENICKQFRLPIADLTKKELSWLGGDVGEGDERTGVGVRES